MSFTLATWNINSVRLRENLVARLMSEQAPDVLCLQECKSPVEKIPLEQFQALGYNHKKPLPKTLHHLAMHATLRVVWKMG